MKLTKIIVASCVALICSQATTSSATSPVTKKPPTLPKATANADSENLVFSGVFEFKGLVIGQSPNDAFPNGVRAILIHPRELVFAGLLPLQAPKDVKSADFHSFACSKELGAAAVDEYEKELDIKIRERKRGQEEMNFMARDGRYGISEVGIQSANDLVMYAINDKQKWNDAKKASEMGYAECGETIANRRIVSTKLSFYKQQLGLILIIFDAKDFDIVKVGLTEKYGRPLKSNKAKLNLKFTGAPSNYVSEQWKDSKGSLLTIANHEQDGSVFREKGILLIENPEFTERLADERRINGSIPATKDL